MGVQIGRATNSVINAVRSFHPLFAWELIRTGSVTPIRPFGSFVSLLKRWLIREDSKPRQRYLSKCIVTGVHFCAGDQNQDAFQFYIKFWGNWNFWQEDFFG